MPRLAFDIEMPDFREISERGLARAKKEAGKVAMEWFRGRRLKKRFDGSMQDELKFQKREGRTNWRKKRFGSFGISLRRTGQSARIARQSPIRVTKKFMGITIRGLNRGFSPRQRRKSHPPMWNELQRISRPEQLQIFEIYKQEYVNQLNIELQRAGRRRRKA